MALYGSAWIFLHILVPHSFHVVSFGIAWYCIIAYITAWYCIVAFGARTVSRKTPFYFI